MTPRWQISAQSCSRHNETNGTARDRSISKALILLSRRLNALLESEIKEKEQDIRALEALIARD